MAVKQTGRKVYKSMQGKAIDMDLLRQKNPEDLIHNKEVFYLEKYLEKFSSDLNGLYNGLSDKYPEAKDSLKQIRENYGHLFSGNDLQEDFKFFKSNRQHLKQRMLRTTHITHIS